MQEIIQFVSNLITEGVAYDSLKVILGSSFNKLTSYLSNNEKEKFEGALEILLEQNEEMKQQIIELQKGKPVISVVFGKVDVRSCVVSGNQTSFEYQN